MKRHLTRLWATLITTTTLLLVSATTALAAPMTAGADDNNAPLLLKWVDLKDSRGISMWNYELSIDRGGFTSPDKFFWSAQTDLSWGIYRFLVGLAIWFLDWIMSFDWLMTIASPLLAVGDALQEIINNIGLVPTFLTFSALVAGLWMFKGRHATAVWEFAIICVIAALAGGIFARPVDLIAGPDGLIVSTNEFGQEIAADLATGNSAGKSADELHDMQITQLIDTFMRQPAQMINFGEVLDGGSCESTYNEILATYDEDDDIRDAVGDCNDAYGDYAAHPNVDMTMGAFIFMPAGFVIFALAISIAGAVLVAGVWAAYQSCKAIVTLVTGLLPGGARASLMLTVAETLISLLIIVMTSAFLSIFLLIIQAVFSAPDPISGVPVAPARSFVIADIVIIAGLVVYRRQRKKMKESGSRLAGALMRRPGGAAPVRLPEASQRPNMALLSSALKTATGFAIARARAGARTPTPGPSTPSPKPNPTPPPAPAPVSDNAPSPARRIPRRTPSDAPTQVIATGDPSSAPTQVLANDSSSAPTQTIPVTRTNHAKDNTPPPETDTSSTSKADALKKRLRPKALMGTIARVGVDVALASASGGTSAVVKVAQTAQRARVMAQIARSRSAKAPGGAQTPAPAPGAARAATTMRDLRAAEERELAARRVARTGAGAR